MPRDAYGGQNSSSEAERARQWYAQNPTGQFSGRDPLRQYHRSDFPSLSPMSASQGQPSQSFMPPSYQSMAPGPMLTPAIQQQPQENSMWTNVWGTQYNMWGGLGGARRGALQQLMGGGGF
mgnify:FL=1